MDPGNSRAYLNQHLQMFCNVTLFFMMGSMLGSLTWAGWGELDGVRVEPALVKVAGLDQHMPLGCLMTMRGLAKCIPKSAGVTCLTQTVNAGQSHLGRWGRTGWGQGGTSIGQGGGPGSGWRSGCRRGHGGSPTGTRTPCARACWLPAARSAPASARCGPAHAAAAGCPPSPCPPSALNPNHILIPPWAGLPVCCIQKLPDLTCAPVQHVGKHQMCLSPKTPSDKRIGDVHMLQRAGNGRVRPGTHCCGC